VAVNAPLALAPTNATCSAVAFTLGVVNGSDLVPQYAAMIGSSPPAPLRITTSAGHATVKLVTVRTRLDAVGVGAGNTATAAQFDTLGGFQSMTAPTDTLVVHADRVPYDATKPPDDVNTFDHSRTIMTLPTE
jgi:hypothetical protein